MVWAAVPGTMTTLQKILRYVYKARMQFSDSTGLGKNIKMNQTNAKPAVSFFSLSAEANNGESRSMEVYRGKYLLIVNLASNCGFTAQYGDLEALYRAQSDKLVILGFPANDFGGQEPGSDESIASFCQLNFGVTFPLFKKGSVKGAGMQPLYQWLTDPAKNGWNSDAPSWNFCKYLLNPDGELIGFFTSAVNPMSPEITGHLK